MEEVKEGVRPKTAERRDIVKEQHPLSLSRRVYDRTLRGLLYLCAGLTCALLLFLIGYIFYRGLPHITWELVSTQESILNDTTGILPSILNTVYVVVVTMLVVLPLGVGAAVYLTEYASNRRLVAAIEFATETLAGIPSIIYAMVGVLIFSQFMSLGKTLLAASLTLVILTLPTIIRTTQESLKTVPQSYREGSLGLGSGKWHMIRTVVLPNSIDGADVHRRHVHHAQPFFRLERRLGRQPGPDLAGPDPELRRHPHRGSVRLCQGAGPV